MSTENDGAGSAAPPVLAMTGIHKSYGGVHALRGAHLLVERPGEIHGLMGENGSGKSSLLKILAGQTRADAGEIALLGEPAEFRSSAKAIAAGVAMVAQETALAERLSIAENVLLGRRMVRTGFGIDWRASNEKAGAILGRLRLDFDPRRPVSTLRAGEKQMVEIARVLSMDAKVVILDEPTSSLGEDEVERLHDVMRDIRDQGVSIILVSHRLPEVFALSDRLTVLRDGRTVASGAAGEFTVDSLVDAMVGEGSERDVAPREGVRGEPVLTTRGLTRDGEFYDVDLTVHRGEIVGVAGLAGAGRSELLAGIFASGAAASGSVAVGGRDLSGGSSRESIGAGLGYLPPSRAEGGLLLGLSVRENLVVVANSRRRRLARPRGRAERAAIAPLMKRMRVRAADPSVAVRTLSGGNQQKIALGRWLSIGLAAFLLDEPTRGVDVVAKREIHELLRSCADDGLALLVSSSEYDELLEICDRVIVMHRGRIVGETPVRGTTEAMLSRMAGGHR